MQDTAIEAVCRDCGRPVSFHTDGTRAVRCAECFTGVMQARDIEFLSSYAELGVASRRVVAETCLRAFVTESPPHRKVLAMTIMDQYVLAAGDLVGLYSALKQRGREPIMRQMLEFKLDRASTMAFFQEMANTPQPEILDAVGLPMPEDIARRCPSLSTGDVRDLKRAMVQMLGDLKRTGEMGEGAALALAQASGESRAGAAMMNQSAWLDSIGLRADQVASVAIDEQRRTINISAISVDEKRLQNVISAIDAMTNASRNLIYAVLTMHQEDERARQIAAKAPRGRAAR